MLDQMSRDWWIIALQGVAAIVFGILTLVWPEITLLVLVFLFAAYALVDGVLALIRSLRRDGKGGRPDWWRVARGVVGIAAGLIAFAMPDITAYALLLVIAAWAIVSGAIELVAAYQLRESHEDAVPQPRAGPAVEPGRHRPPGPEPLRQVAPRRAGLRQPEQRVEDEPVVLRRPARPRPPAAGAARAASTRGRSARVVASRAPSCLGVGSRRRGSGPPPGGACGHRGLAARAWGWSGTRRRSATTTSTPRCCPGSRPTTCRARRASLGHRRKLLDAIAACARRPPSAGGPAGRRDAEPPRAGTRPRPSGGSSR